MVDRHQLKLGPLAALAALAAPAALAIPPAPAAGARRVPVPLLGRLGEARLGEGMLGRADEDVALVPVAVEEAQVLQRDTLAIAQAELTAVEAVLARVAATLDELLDRARLLAQARAWVGVRLRLRVGVRAWVRVGVWVRVSRSGACPCACAAAGYPPPSWAPARGHG